MVFVILSNVPPVPNLWRIFILKGSWILSLALSASIEMTMWLLFFILFMLFMTCIDLRMLNHPCITKINPTWFMYVCDIWSGLGYDLQVFYCQSLHLFSLRVYICNFLLYYTFVWFCFYSHTGLIKKEKMFGIVPSCSVFQSSLKSAGIIYSLNVL